MPLDVGEVELQSLALQNNADGMEPMTLILKARQMRAEEIHRLLTSGIKRVTGLIITPYTLRIDYI